MCPAGDAGPCRTDENTIRYRYIDAAKAAVGAGPDGLCPASAAGGWGGGAMAEAAVQATKAVPGAAGRGPTACRAIAHARGARRMFSEPGEAAERSAGARSLRTMMSAAADADLVTCATGGCSGCGQQRDDQVRTSPSPTATLAASIPPSDQDQFVTQSGGGPAGTGQLQTQDAGPPAAALAGNFCSPTSATFTSIPSGTLTPTFSGGVFGAPFVMRATSIRRYLAPAYPANTGSSYGVGPRSTARPWRIRCAETI